MQIFMRNIAFQVKEDDLKIGLAKILHHPPFNVNPKINFHIELFYQKRSRAHRGMGLLTLPSEEIGTLFLSVVRRGTTILGRIIAFSRSTRDPNAALIQKVAHSQWEDPLEVIRERQRIAQESAPIIMSRVSFGHFCRDGVFSAEVDIHGPQTQAICDISNRLLQLKISPSESITHPWTLESLAELFTARDVHYIHYAASSITAFAISSTTGVPRVFIEAEHPPTFMRSVRSAFDDSTPPAQRLASVYGHEQMPPVTQGLCLSFRSEHELHTFVARCKGLHFPHPKTRNIPVENRSLYAAPIWADLNDFLGCLSFPLAFEIEKAIYAGILVPTEVVGDLRKEISGLEVHGADAAPIFNSFVLSLESPGIELLSIAHRPGKNRRRRKRKNPAQTLAQKLSEEAATYISRLYQPRGRLSSITQPLTAGIYRSYHLIITPTGRMLEGPLPDQSNSVLRRFGNHECFLRVSFQDETRSKPRRDPNLLIDELLNFHYKPLLVDGLKVAGRQYEFLGYSMSGLKEYAFTFVRPFHFEGMDMDATEIRDMLGDFHRIQHHPALLGARWSQAFSASDPSVVLEPNEIVFIADRKSKEGSVFTDGCGTISPQLARVVWRVLQKSRKRAAKLRDVPSAFQFRLGGAKGILVQDPTLRGRVVCLRESQTKFTGTTRSLDISTTSSRPIAVYLNRTLIALLEHHGVDESYIKDLQERAINEVYALRDSLSFASTTFNQHGLGSSFKLSSLFSNLYSVLGLDVQRRHGLINQLIITCLHYAMIHILRDIKHRARILVPGSYTLIGVSDEWGYLGEGEIYATVCDERTGEYKTVIGQVLITRSPQIHPGDLQMVTAVRRPELAHLKNVVVFPCRGKRSLPSMLGGGDLDGDIFNLILDPNLHPPSGDTAVPGDYTPLPRRQTDHPCTVSDVADFVIDYIKTDLLGHISILHLRIADLKSPDCEECMLLAEKASHAVDFPKTGTPVDLTSLPRPPDRMKPDFLSGEGINPEVGSSFYPSQKLLGVMYRNVPDEEYHPRPELMHITDGEKIIDALNNLDLPSLGLPFLDGRIDEDLYSEMDDILEEYSTQLHTIAKAHCRSKKPSDHLSEAELVSGTIQARWTDARRRREATVAMNLQTQELNAAIRRELRGVAPARSTYDGSTNEEESGDEDDDEESYYEDFDDYDGFFYDQERHRQIFTRAYAAWIVAEETLKDDNNAFGPSSFGLIALGMMLEIVKARRRAYH